MPISFLCVHFFQNIFKSGIYEYYFYNNFLIPMKFRLRHDSQRYILTTKLRKINYNNKISQTKQFTQWRSSLGRPSCNNAPPHTVA